MLYKYPIKIILSNPIKTISCLKVSPEMLVAFFSGVGEIKYVRQSVNEKNQER